MGISENFLLVVFFALVLLMFFLWQKKSAELRRLKRKMHEYDKLARDFKGPISVTDIGELIKILQAETNDLHKKLAQQTAVSDLTLANAAERFLTERADSVLQTRYEFMSKITNLHNALISGHALLKEDVEALLGIVNILERWHDEMQTIYLNNSDLKTQNEEFSRLVKSLVILAVNGSIEAARSGEHGRGFAIVANEMRDLARASEKLAHNYKQNLYKNDLITTTTFQDLQASSNMIRTVVSGLHSSTNNVLSIIASANSSI